MDGLSEFNLLATEGNLGYYTSCELTSIFLLRNNETAINYFSIFTFEERPIRFSKAQYLMNKLIPINKEYRLGIGRIQLSVETVRSIFSGLQSAGSNAVADLGLGSIVLGSMDLIRKQFVPIDSTATISLNRILKSNLNNGSYILEFFDSQKQVLHGITEKQQLTIAMSIMEYIPVDLQVISDRIGNIIFQFPAQVFGMRFSFPRKKEISATTGNLMLHDDGDKVDLEFDFDPRIDWNNRYVAIASNESDDTVVGYSVEVISRTCVTLSGLFTNDITRLHIQDRRTKLLVHAQQTVPMLQMEFNMQLQSSKRVINSGKEIILHSSERFSVGYTNDSFEDCVNRRKYELHQKEIVEKQEMLQYGSLDNEHEDALVGIRKIIETRAKKRIYLWDMYLSAEDIINTLYYCNVFNLEMRAITSKKVVDLLDKGTKLDNWIKQQRDFFAQCDNTGINLNFRCQRGKHGRPFHDRFLILIDHDEKANVWALGSSLNSIGKGHTIIQLTKNPQFIVDAFNDLWRELEAEECQVWRC